MEPVLQPPPVRPSQRRHERARWVGSGGTRGADHRSRLRASTDRTLSVTQPIATRQPMLTRTRGSNDGSRFRAGWGGRPSACDRRSAAGCGAAVPRAHEAARPPHGRKRHHAPQVVGPGGTRRWPRPRCGCNAADGLGIGELLELELDCVHELPGHGSWPEEFHSARWTPSGWSRSTPRSSRRPDTVAGPWVGCATAATAETVEMTTAPSARASARFPDRVPIAISDWADATGSVGADRGGGRGPRRRVRRRSHSMILSRPSERVASRCPLPSSDAESVVEPDSEGEGLLARERSQRVTDGDRVCA